MYIFQGVIYNVYISGCDEETCVAPNGECADDKSRCWCSDTYYGVNCENTFTEGRVTHTCTVVHR